MHCPCLSLRFRGADCAACSAYLSLTKRNRQTCDCELKWNPARRVYDASDDCYCMPVKRCPTTLSFRRASSLDFSRVRSRLMGESWAFQGLVMEGTTLRNNAAVGDFGAGILSGSAGYDVPFSGSDLTFEANCAADTGSDLWAWGATLASSSPVSQQKRTHILRHGRDDLRLWLIRLSSIVKALVTSGPGFAG